MPKLKREIFMRPNRMVHRFGDKDDPWVMPEQYFDFEGPKGVKVKNGPTPKPCSIQDYGLKVHTPPQSPVTKARGGRAAFGPRVDNADTVAEALPPSTRERRTSGPLAEPVTKVQKKGRE